MNITESISEHARKIFRRTRGSHDWEHTERVAALAAHIAEKEGADPFVVNLAAVLHDIARHREDRSKGKICHAAAGAEMARPLLSRYGVRQEIIDRISHCIETHRFRNDRAPSTIEARVLFDADKLDAIGAVGIGRAFLFAGEVGAKLHNKTVDIDATKPYTEEDTAYREFMVKLRHIKDRMLTEEGKRIAAERHDYMVGFFNRLDEEIGGGS
jgi:uncharacterized protein